MIGETCAASSTQSTEQSLNDEIATLRADNAKDKMSMTRLEKRCHELESENRADKKALMDLQLANQQLECRGKEHEDQYNKMRLEVQAGHKAFTAQQDVIDDLTKRNQTLVTREKEQDAKADRAKGVLGKMQEKYVQSCKDNEAEKKAFALYRDEHQHEAEKQQDVIDDLTKQNQAMKGREKEYEDQADRAIEMMDRMQKENEGRKNSFALFRERQRSEANKQRMVIDGLTTRNNELELKEQEHEDLKERMESIHANYSNMHMKNYEAEKDAFTSLMDRYGKMAHERQNELLNGNDDPNPGTMECIHEKYSQLHAKNHEDERNAFTTLSDRYQSDTDLNRQVMNGLLGQNRELRIKDTQNKKFLKELLESELAEREATAAKAKNAFDRIRSNFKAK